jgi:hypothetical protein
MKEETLRGWSFILQARYEALIKNHSLNLTPANVLVAELPKSTLGQWQKNSRALEISIDLLMRGNWSEIDFTLKHELAHQIVDEIYSLNERPHGASFARACQQLGISHQATVSLSSSKESSLQKKISKLLALSNSSNENESAAALAKAHELSCKHNLALIEQGDESFNLLPVGEIRKKIPRYEHTVMAILAEFYFVKVLQNFRLNRQGEKVGWQFEIYGNLENLATSEYIYYFLRNQGLALWSEYRREQGSSVSRKKPMFLSGLYDGFYRKLKKDHEDFLNKFAMVKVSNDNLDVFFRSLNPSVRQRTMRHSIDPKIYNDGVAQGKNMRIHHGVGKKPGKGLAGFLESNS